MALWDCFGVSVHQLKSLVVLPGGVLHSSVPVPYSHSLRAGPCAQGTDPAEKERKKQKKEFGSGLIHQSGYGMTPR